MAASMNAPIPNADRCVAAFLVWVAAVYPPCDAKSATARERMIRAAVQSGHHPAKGLADWNNQRNAAALKAASDFATRRVMGSPEASLRLNRAVPDEWSAGD